MQKSTHIALASTSVIAALSALACSGSGGSARPEISKQAAGLVARPAARLFLSDTVIQRLQARAAAGDTSWTDLKQRCDDYATGTVYPPTGTAYPNYPSIGQGYQGDEYFPAIRAIGLCYQTVRGVDAAAEARYGDVGSRLLSAMSLPAGSGGQAPSTDSGYGIRHFGVGMALGYDWLYPALSQTVKTQVITALKAWFDWYDVNGFIHNDPVGNYFAGYFLAKTTAALATEGDDPSASTYWDDVVNRMWGQLVKPQFTAKMSGGGWPEGWGYGKRAVLSIGEAMWAAKTAKGLDWWGELPQVRDQAKYVMHFTWPSLKHMDDQGTIHSGLDLRASSELVSGLATMLEASGDAAAPVVRGFASDVVATVGDDRSPWSRFLYGDPGAPQASYTSEPLSHFAAGPGHVAVRSSWDQSAVWGALSGGTYINAKDSGEQLYDSGNLSVVQGDQPVLINATGWLPQNAGTDGENFVYDDTYGTKQRRLYNTFFVNDSSNPYNPGQNNFGPDQSKAHIERYEDRGGFVRVRAANLEDQYGWSNGSRPITQYTRDLVYVRPGTFVLFDRTTVAQGSADQWLSFHAPVAPTAVSTADSTQHRFDVIVGGTIAGSVRTLLPKSVTTGTTSLPGGAARLEAHVASPTASQQWLSVVSAGAVPEQVRLSAPDGNVTTGALVGVLVQSARNQVVLFSADQAATGSASSAEYAVQQTADADHVLVDMAPSSSGYAVTATLASGVLKIRVTQGGSYQVSAAGTLSFSVTTAGTVSAPNWTQPASTPTPVPSTPDPSTPVPSTPDPSTPVPSTPDPSTPVPSTPDPPPTASTVTTASFTYGVDGYASEQDASISSLYLSHSNPVGATFKTNDRLYAYRIDYTVKALLRFDVSSIPSSASVSSATLDLTFESWLGPQVLTGNFLATQWDYSSSVLGWSNASNTVRWLTAGIGASDVIGGAFQFTGIDASGYQRKSVQLDPAMVGAWVKDPAQNHGIVLANADANRVLRVFSAESSDPAQRPTLTVSYSP